MEGCDIMFIVTARLPKKRVLAGAAAALCCCILAILALASGLGRGAVAVSAEVKNIKSNDDRLAYLNGLAGIPPAHRHRGAAHPGGV